MNILGVIFDSKLQWSDPISHSIKRSMKALNAMRLIRKFFTKRELLSLITSNFYSILHYNSEIWHLPSLKRPLNKVYWVHRPRLLECVTEQIINVSHSITYMPLVIEPPLKWFVFIKWHFAFSSYTTLIIIK